MTNKNNEEKKHAGNILPIFQNICKICGLEYPVVFIPSKNL